MKELHTPGPWDFESSTEDYQGHFIVGNGRTVAATHTADPTEDTREDVANMSLIVTAPAMLAALRRIAREANFRQKGGALELGERLMAIEREARAAIAAYESQITKLHKDNK